jgi:aldehyde:ferredoxin oxidoreductase
MGTRKFLETLLHVIAHREGFGDVLAEGVMRAKEHVSKDAQALMSHAVAPIGRHDNVPPRAYIVNALLYPFEPRMHPITVHELIYACIPWRQHQADPNLTPITPEIFCQIAKTFWGSEDAADQTTYKGKALAAKNIQNRTYLRDSLGLCDFVWPITYSLNTPDHLGDPALEGKIFTAVTGIPASELDTYAERIFNMQRLILVREEHRIPDDDYPPEFNFILPLKTNPHGMPVMVPGPGAKSVSATGKVLDRDKFTTMLKEYYGLRGWDEVTGLPTKDTLNILGMEDMVSGL